MEELIKNGSLYMNDSLDIISFYTEGLESLSNITTCINIRLSYTIAPKTCLLLYRNGLNFGMFQMLISALFGFDRIAKLDICD